MKQEYLGDGLYVVFDGWRIELRANSLENPSDRVFLIPDVWNALKDFVNNLEVKSS